MRIFGLLVGLVFAGVSIALSDADVQAADKPRVSIELRTRPGLPITASQQWYQTLTDLGIGGLQIRSGSATDAPSITQGGGKSSPDYRVVGILAADNQLYVPGGKFKTSDTAGLKKWLANLADQGAVGVTESRGAFGLIPKQLEAVNDDLQRPVAISTVGLTAGEAVNQIGRGLKYPIEVDSRATAELKKLKVADELMGISSGTALAILLRPAGLVLVPERPAGGELHYRVGRPISGGQAWPIGWKPTGKPNEVLPELLEFLNVEITETPVAQTVDAIRGRLKAPVLYDHNALALHGIDPAKINADVPGKRMTYSQVLRRVLTKAHLQYELRVDEADKPLIWITSVKAAP